MRWVKGCCLLVLEISGSIILSLNREESEMVIQNDDEGRDLAATLPGEGFTWELWVDLETDDTVVRKRYPNNVSRVVGQCLEIPPLVDNFQAFLENFTKTCAREDCGHPKSKHTGITGQCRWDSDTKKEGFIPPEQMCRCLYFLPPSEENKVCGDWAKQPRRM